MDSSPGKRNECLPNIQLIPGLVSTFINKSYENRLLIFFIDLFPQLLLIKLLFSLLLCLSEEVNKKGHPNVFVSCITLTHKCEKLSSKTLSRCEFSQSLNSFVLANQKTYGSIKLNSSSENYF